MVAWGVYLFHFMFPSPNKVDSVLKLFCLVCKYLLKDCEQIDYYCVRKQAQSKLSFAKRVKPMKKVPYDHCSL